MESVTESSLMELVQPPLFWLGAVTAAWLSLCSIYRLLNGVKIWILGNGKLVSPTRLGKWAGQYDDTYSLFVNNIGKLASVYAPDHADMPLQRCNKPVNPIKSTCTYFLGIQLSQIVGILGVLRFCHTLVVE